MWSPQLYFNCKIFRFNFFILCTNHSEIVTVLSQQSLFYVKIIEFTEHFFWRDFHVHYQFSHEWNAHQMYWNCRRSVLRLVHSTVASVLICSKTMFFRTTPFGRIGFVRWRLVLLCRVKNVTRIECHIAWHRKIVVRRACAVCAVRSCRLHFLSSVVFWSHYATTSRVTIPWTETAFRFTQWKFK